VISSVIFFQQGWDYFVLERTKGAAAAEAWNRGTEYKTGPLTGGGFGESSTGVMSNADLEVNRQGGKFYKDLAALSGGAVATIKICDYVNANWNEENNPNDYLQSLKDKVTALVWH
jgi:phage-related protein